MAATKTTAAIPSATTVRRNALDRQTRIAAGYRRPGGTSGGAHHGIGTGAAPAPAVAWVLEMAGTDDREPRRPLPDFLTALEDESVPLCVDRREGDETYPVLVCFGGLRNVMSGLQFEFVRHTEGMPVHRIFARDLAQCWYQQGLAGIAPDVPSTALALRSVLDDLGPGRRVFVGTSAGAYAAVLFGVLCPADEILAFGPQEALTRWCRLRSRDNRWKDMVKKARASAVDRSHLDLVRLLRAHPDHGPVAVHYGNGDHADTVYASHLGRLPGVTGGGHPGGHAFVRQLRDNGELSVILKNALQGG